MSGSGVDEEGLRRDDVAGHRTAPAGWRGAAISVRNLRRTYRRNDGTLLVANDDISLDIAPGEVVGLLGPNGAGKTTLVHQILGLALPTSGSIFVAGVDVLERPFAAKAMIGFLPQRGLAMGMIEVRRALHFTGRLRGQDERRTRVQVDEVLDELGLSAYADSYVNRLSGGVRRMANIGTALMGDPPILVLDEPTNDLDPENRRVVWSALQRRSIDEGVSVLLVTHNVGEAERAVDRVAVMGEGRLVAVGTPGELKTRLDGGVLLEFAMAKDRLLSDRERAAMAVVGQVDEAHRAGRYVVHAAAENLPRLVAVMAADVGLGELDDFRLSKPTLEDVCLALAHSSGRTEGPVTPSATAAAATTAAAARLPDREPLGLRLRRFAVGCRYLWLEQMLEIRTTWMWNVMFGVLMPFAMVFGIARIGAGLTDRASLVYIVSGAAVFAVVTEAVMNLALRLGMMRFEGRMSYYASLPIDRIAFVLAQLGSRLLLVLPGLFTPILASNLLYGTRFAVTPVLLVVILLSSVSMAAVGIALGSLIIRIEVIALVTNLVTFVLLLAAPIFIPRDSLPAPLQVVGYVLPPTYAADAMRRVLLGDGSGFPVLDLAILAAMAFGGLLVGIRALRWRAG